MRRKLILYLFASSKSQNHAAPSLRKPSCGQLKYGISILMLSRHLFHFLISFKTPSQQWREHGQSLMLLPDSILISLSVWCLWNGLGNRSSFAKSCSQGMYWFANSNMSARYMPKWLRWICSTALKTSVCTADHPIVRKMSLSNEGRRLKACIPLPIFCSQYEPWYKTDCCDDTTHWHCV